MISIILRAMCCVQARILESGQPYAFFFEMLREGRHYTVSFDGVEDAGARTGAFTTLKVQCVPGVMNALYCKFQENFRLCHVDPATGGHAYVRSEAKSRCGIIRLQATTQSHVEDRSTWRTSLS